MEPDAAFHLVSLMPGDELRQGGALSDGKVVNLLLRGETQATWLKCAHQHAVARMHIRIMNVQHSLPRAGRGPPQAGRPGRSA